MSRIGNRELNIPEGVTVTVDNNVVTVTGSKGTLTFEYKNDDNVEVKEGKVIVTRKND